LKADQEVKDDTENRLDDERDWNIYYCVSKSLDEGVVHRCLVVTQYDRALRE